MASGVVIAGAEVAGEGFRDNGPMNITRVVAPNPGPFTGEGTNSYIVVSGSAALIIDPGPLIPSHLSAIRANLEGLTPVGIAVTHHHQDHAPAANPMAAELGVVSYGFGDFGGFQANSPIADGDVIQVGYEALTVVSSPGHTPDSLCFLAEDALFAGDTIKSGSTVVVDDMTAYMATLERLAALAVENIYPGHGEPIHDGSATLASYIEHRQVRERQIMAALTADIHSLDGIIALVYGNIDPTLRPLARQSALAHLQKLASEGRAVLEGDDWRASP